MFFFESSESSSNGFPADMECFCHIGFRGKPSVGASVGAFHILSEKFRDLEIYGQSGAAFDLCVPENRELLFDDFGVKSHAEFLGFGDTVASETGNPREKRQIISFFRLTFFRTDIYYFH